MSKLKKLFPRLFCFYIVFLFFAPQNCYADDNLISLFPIENYDQTLSNWISPKNPNYDKPLLGADMQKARLDMFYVRYFGSQSPWNAEYINQIFLQQPPDDITTVEKGIIDGFNNDNKPDKEIGYGENFRPHTQDWISNLSNNININQFSNLAFQENHRGIAVHNLLVRALPTDDVHFLSYKLAGQGYPFDNLQMTAMWAGTPVYIVGKTLDNAWTFVISPNVMGWVKSNGVAKANSAFINIWQKAAKNKLMAITQTKTSLNDSNGNFLVSAYVGSVFPSTSKDFQMMVPAADANGNAIIKFVNVSPSNAAVMPLTATPHHFSDLMSTLIGRPYGWGNMYFYNDCSAELKNLFTPFGIWLPRHSSDQVSQGKMVDLTKATPDKRLAYLIQHGRPYITIIYIGGHVILYIGNYPSPSDPHTLMAMTYQNIWGLSPNPPDRRAVIGGSVLFPMLLQYPEDPTLVSLAAKKFFQISYLNQLPELIQIKPIVNIKSLMMPDDKS